MKLILTDKNNEVLFQLRLKTKNFHDVEVVPGNFFEVAERYKVDAVVSPANSFGFMDGGIDAFYTDYFGGGLQKNLQEEIKKRKHQELLVGESLLVPTNHDKIPYMISSPTMRVPAPINNTVNVYLAFRSTLRLAMSNKLTIISPCFGTGAGRMNPNVAVSQMVKAYEDNLYGSSFPMNLYGAWDKHDEILGLI